MNMMERIARWIGWNFDDPTTQKVEPLRQLLEQGRMFKREERYADALSTLEKAANLEALTPNPTLLAIIEINRADIFVQQARWQDAETILNGLKGLFPEQDRTTAYLLDTFGVLAQAQGEWEPAREFYEQARVSAQQTGAVGAEGRSEGHLADVYMQDGNASYSVHLLKEALEKLNSSGDIELSSYFTGRLGEALIATGQEGQGRQLLGRALRIAQQMKQRMYERQWHLALAEQAMLLDSYVTAKQHFLQALSTIDEDKSGKNYILLLNRLSKTCLLLREYDDALGYARRAVEFSERLQGEGDAMLVMAQGMLGIVLRALQQYPLAITYLEQATAGYAKLPSDTIANTDYSQVEILRNLGTCLAETGEVEQAFDTFQQALKLAQEKEDAMECAGTHRDMGVLETKRSNHKEAISQWTKALDLYERVDDYARMARLYNDIGNLRREQGEYDWAMKDFERALTALNLADEPETRGIVLANAAVAYIDEGDIDTAEAFMVEAIQLAQQIDDRTAEAIRRGNYGWLLLTTGRATRALDTLGYAHQQSVILGLDVASAVQLDNMGLAHYELGSFNNALNAHRQALSTLPEAGSTTPYWRAVIHANLGHTLLAIGDETEPTGAFEQAFTLAQENDYPDVLARVLTGQSKIAIANDDLQNATSLIETAVQNGKRARKRRIYADALALQSEIQAKSGQIAEASATWENAQQLYALLRLQQAEKTPNWLPVDTPHVTEEEK
ncbi:MAG: tetratricopeptide repeat protein [Aggregatilineales bacterium]